MFSAIGAPSEQDIEDIDWIGDLKFFIDNDDKILSNVFFPAVKKHKEHVDHPNVFKVYMKPIQHCLDRYVEQFEIEDPHDKFPKEKLIELAKQIAEEQARHIERGDYED